MRPSTVRLHRSSGTVLVAPVGELDLLASCGLRSALLGACTAGGRVVVDLAYVTFVDSAALGVLVAAARRAADEDCAVELVNARPRVLALLRLTGLVHLLDVRP